MLQKTLFVLLLSVALTTGLTFLLQKTYPYVLASEEARKSVEVTPAQQAELNGVDRSNDMIAFAIIGAVTCGLLPLAIATKRDPKTSGLGIGSGLVLGALGGMAAGWLGHWIEDSPLFDFGDLMTHTLIRWILMLTPVAIAFGVANGLADGKTQSIGKGIVGGILGIVVASAIYAFLAGVISTPEGRNKILPFYDANRAIIIAAVVVCMGLGVLLQNRKPASSSDNLSEEQSKID